MELDVPRRIASFTLDDLSEERRRVVNESVLDTIGCAIAGDRMHSSKVLRDATGEWESPGTRALVLGTAAHSVEMDDFHNGATVHPGVVVVPAVIEAALAENATGRELLAATAVGYEMAISVGRAGRGTFYERGFHATSVAGVFGAAAAVGHLRGLSPTELANAFGIAGSNAGGLLEYKSEGAWTKRLQVGMGAETGVRAVSLAESGFTGPSTILDGKYGFLDAYAETSDGTQLERFGSFASLSELSYKPYACCRYIHQALDAFDEIASDDVADPGSIEAIEVETHQQAIDSTVSPIERKYAPERTVDAQFSMPFALGVAAVHDGQVLPHHLTGAALEDPDVLDVAETVDVEATEEFTERFPRENGARVRVVTDRGTSESTCWTPKGDPENPMTRSELVGKFERLAEPSLSDPATVADSILDFENGREISTLESVVP